MRSGGSCGGQPAAGFPLAKTAARRYTAAHNRKPGRGRGGQRGDAAETGPGPRAGLSGGCRPAATDPLIRAVLRDESLTRDLGDVEARMLVEWVTDWTELLADAARSDDDARELVARLTRRGKAISRFVRLWGDPRARGAATQLAAVERFAWPLPAGPLDPPDLMQHILAWESPHPAE